MKKAHTFGLRNSLFMALFSLQSSLVERLGAVSCQKKVENFPFFSFLLQYLSTLLTVKSALFEFELKPLLNYLVNNFMVFLGSEYLNLVANFESFLNFSQFLSHLEFEFQNVKLSKIEFLESLCLNLVANFKYF